jgi:hypothetical protein
MTLKSSEPQKDREQKSAIKEIEKIILRMAVMGKTFASIATKMSTADYRTIWQVGVFSLEMIKVIPLPISHFQALKLY